MDFKRLFDMERRYHEPDSCEAICLCCGAMASRASPEEIDELDDDDVVESDGTLDRCHACGAYGTTADADMWLDPSFVEARRDVRAEMSAYEEEDDDDGPPSLLAAGTHRFTSRRPRMAVTENLRGRAGVCGALHPARRRHCTRSSGPHAGGPVSHCRLRGSRKWMRCLRDVVLNPGQACLHLRHGSGHPRGERRSRCL